MIPLEARRVERAFTRASRANALTLNQLEVFGTVAKTGSFTRAGEILLRSEPAISQQIKLLEDLVGIRLLDRARGRPIRLTEAGRLMLEASEDVLERVDRAIEGLAAMSRFESGTMIVGAGAYFGSYLLPSMCAPFNREFPGIHIRLRIARGAECVELVRNADVELAVVGGDHAGPDIEHVHLAGKDIVLVASPDHPLASRRGLTFADIASQSLVLAPTTSSSRRALDKWASMNGSVLHPRLELTGAEAQITAVRTSLGIAAVPVHALGRYPTAALRVLDVSGFPLREGWSIIWRKGELSPAAEALRDHLLAERARIEMNSLAHTARLSHDPRYTPRTLPPDRGASTPQVPQEAR